MVPSDIDELDAMLGGGFPAGCFTNIVCENHQLRREVFDWMSNASHLAARIYSCPQEADSSLGRSSPTYLLYVLNSESAGKRREWWKENGADIMSRLGLRAWVGFSGGALSWPEEHLSSLTLEVTRQGKNCLFEVLPGRYQTSYSRVELSVPALQCNECKGTGISGEIFATRCWKCGGRQS